MQVDEYLKMRNLPHLKLNSSTIQGKECVAFPVWMWAYSDKPVGVYYRSMEGSFHYKMFLPQYSGFYYSYPRSFVEGLYGRKVVVVEGVIDAEILRRYGIPSLAMMTRKVPAPMIRDLKFLSNSVLLIPDNDLAGKSSIKHNLTTLHKSGISCEVVYLKQKDIGEIPEGELLRCLSMIQSMIS